MSPHNPVTKLKSLCFDCLFASIRKAVVSIENHYEIHNLFFHVNDFTNDDEYIYDFIII